MWIERDPLWFCTNLTVNMLKWLKKNVFWLISCDHLLVKVVIKQAIEKEKKCTGIAGHSCRAENQVTSIRNWSMLICEWVKNEEREKKEDLKASFPSVILDTTHCITLGGLSLSWTKKHGLSKILQLQSYEARRNLKPRRAGKVTRIQKKIK